MLCVALLLLSIGATAPQPARALGTGTPISGSWTVGTCTVDYELFSNGQGNISYLDGVLFRFLGGGGFVAIAGGYWQEPLADFDPQGCISGEDSYRQRSDFALFQATSTVSYYGFSYCIGPNLYEYALSGLSNTVVISGNQGPRVECAPTLSATQNSDGTLTVSGTTEPGAAVTVTFPDGSETRVIAAPSGAYTATSDAAQPSGDVTINAEDSAGTQSDTVTIAFTDTQPPEPPTLDPVQGTDGSITANGSAEPGTTVTVTFPDGQTQDVLSDGAFATTSEPEQPAGPVRAIATDLSGNVSQDSVADVRPNPDTSGPTAQLTQVPDGVDSGGTYTLGLVFSEAVTGLERSDMELENARVSELSGTGASYQITIEISGEGDAAFTLPEGSVVDSARNPNVALGPVVIPAASAQETRAKTADFMLGRTGNLLSAQPELIPFLRDQRAGHFTANITTGNGTFSYASPTDQVIWTRLDGSWRSSDGAESRYVLGVLGSHYRISERLLLGAMAQVDHQSTTGSGDAGTVAGTGWMVGPYVVARHNAQPLFYEGRLLYGRSVNKISPSGGYTDSFTTQRWLAEFRMSGEYRMDNTLIFPFIDASFASDHQFGYRDSADRWIAPQSVGVGRLELGHDISHRIDDSLTLTAGMSGIWSITDVSGNSAASGEAHEGGSAELRGGVIYAPTDGVTVKGALSYDGLLRRGYEHVGASVELTSEF